MTRASSAPLAARDGKPYESGTILDGFYVVGDAANPQLAFRCASVEPATWVTPFAPATAKGRIIGSPVLAPGVTL